MHHPSRNFFFGHKFILHQAIILKEGTTAGEVLDLKATFVYAPRTGPSEKEAGGEATLAIEGKNSNL
jgi:hypothetical protein